MLPVVTNHRTFVVPGGFDWIDHEFNRLARDLMGERGAVAAKATAYPVDIHENEESIIVEAEMPGFKKDEINVTIEQGVLQIAAEHAETDQEDAKKGTPLIRERRSSRYARSFKLPTPVLEENVKATFENGVLHLTLPRRPEVKPRRITVG